MEKKRYFKICMGIAIVSAVTCLLAFFVLNRSPKAHALYAEMIWDELNENATMAHHEMPISYYTSFYDKGQILNVEVQTKNGDIGLIASFYPEVMDVKENLAPYTRHIATLGIEYVGSMPITEPIEITAIDVTFENGNMSVPIERLILYPNPKDEEELDITYSVSDTDFSFALNEKADHISLDWNYADTHLYLQDEAQERHSELDDIKGSGKRHDYLFDTSEMKPFVDYILYPTLTIQKGEDTIEKHIRFPRPITKTDVSAWETIQFMLGGDAS